MKFLFALVLIPTLAGAVTLSKQRSVPEGTSLLSFVLSETSAKEEKTSTYFDQKNGDYTIGVHTLKKFPADYKATINKLNELVANFKVADEFLKTKGSSFNAVAGMPEHETILVLDSFRIRPESKYFAELDGIFQELQKLDWKLTQGYQITKDLEKVIEVEKGTSVKTQQYSQSLYCNRAQAPKLCTYHGGGKIYVK